MYLEISVFIQDNLVLASKCSNECNQNNFWPVSVFFTQFSVDKTFTLQTVLSIGINLYKLRLLWKGNRVLRESVFIWTNLVSKFQRVHPKSFLKVFSSFMLFIYQTFTSTGRLVRLNWFVWTLSSLKSCPDSKRYVPLFGKIWYCFWNVRKSALRTVCDKFSVLSYSVYCRPSFYFCWLTLFLESFQITCAYPEMVTKSWTSFRCLYLEGSWNGCTRLQRLHRTIFYKFSLFFIYFKGQDFTSTGRPFLQNWFLWIVLALEIWLSFWR